MPPVRPHGSLGRGARERILAAAETLFARRGINATSMNDLYIEARVSKRTLYQHFAGKDELVLACWRPLTNGATLPRSWRAAT